MADLQSDVAVVAPSPPPTRKRRKPPKEDLVIVKNRTPFFLVLPALITLVVIVIYPMIYSLFYSFHQYNPIVGGAQFIGFGNYKWLWTSPRWYNSLKNLAYYLGVGVLVQMVVAIAIALILYEFVKNKKLQIALLVIGIMPMMLPPSVVGIIWKFIFSPFGGVVNAVLEIGFGVEPINWLGDRLAMTSVLIADIWEWTSLPLMIIYSGRVSLPESVYEAARVDGAKPSLILRRVTLPMLKELIAIAFILRFMDAYKFIDKVSIMTAGGPGEASEVPSYFGYIVGVKQFNIGQATAMVWIIALMATVIITLFIRFMKRVLATQNIH
jgi:multiple sugar transport system permease protein